VRLDSLNELFAGDCCSPESVVIIGPVCKQDPKKECSSCTFLKRKTKATQKLIFLSNIIWFLNGRGNLAPNIRHTIRYVAKVDDGIFNRSLALLCCCKIGAVKVSIFGFNTENFRSGNGYDDRVMRRG
jgi:hypothetical protein